MKNIEMEMLKPCGQSIVQVTWMSISECLPSFWVFFAFR